MKDGRLLVMSRLLVPRRYPKKEIASQLMTPLMRMKLVKNEETMVLLFSIGWFISFLE
jgi:hypothetical protein